MAKTSNPDLIPTDVDVPAIDTFDCRLTPLVLAAMAEGATSRPHETNRDLIVLAFADKGPADAFSAAIQAALS